MFTAVPQAREQHVGTSARSHISAPGAEQLDANDRVLYQRFIAVYAEANFEFPDQKERTGASFKADLQRRRRLRDSRNKARINALEADYNRSMAALAHKFSGS